MKIQCKTDMFNKKTMKALPYYLLMVRSLAKPNSSSTQMSESSDFLDLEEVLGATC